MENNKPQPSNPMKKILVGTVTVIVVLLVIVGYFWMNQGQQSVELKGVVTEIDMENRSFVLEQGKLIKESDGSTRRESGSKMIMWNDGTQFVPNQDRALRNLTSVKVMAPYGADRASETTARSIEMVSPPPEVVQ